MKNILYLLSFIVISCSSFSQKLVGFGGFGIYLNPIFEKSKYFSINAGLEYNSKTVIKPELKFEYFLGTVPDVSIEYNNNVETKFLTRKISAANISISPKISLGEKENTVHFQILPMYNYTIIYASGAIFYLDTSNNNFVKIDSDSYSEVKHSLGIGLAIFFNLNNETFQAIAFELNYNNIDIGNALSKLKVSTDKINTNQSLGIRIKYYFGISKSKK